MEGLADHISRFLNGKATRYQYDKDSERLFLYHALEEVVWDGLARRDKGGDYITHDIANAISEILADNPDAGWVSLTEAVTSYNFLPFGFTKAPVYSFKRELLGYVAVTYGGGMAYPLVATTDSDWISIIHYLLGGAAAPKPEQAFSVPFAYISIPGTDGKIRWVTIDRSRMTPGSDVIGYVKPRELADEDQYELPVWADDDFLLLEPINSWDEGEPEVAELIRESRSKFISAYGDNLDEIEAAYDNHASPLTLCKLWLSLSKILAEADQHGEVNHAELVARAMGLPTLPGSGTKLEDLYAITQVRGDNGFYGELTESATDEGRNRVRIREAQMNKARDLYPEFIQYSTQALTYWWRRYIQDTENPSADVAYDDKYRVDSRPYDLDFVYYMVLVSTENHGPLNYIFTNVNSKLITVAFASLGIREHTKLRVKGAVLMLAYVTEEQDIDVIPELVNDWRVHVTRLVDVACCSAVISKFALKNCGGGPELFSQQDDVYCQQEKIIARYRLPRR